MSELTSDLELDIFEALILHKAMGRVVVNILNRSCNQHHEPAREVC